MPKPLLYNFHGIDLPEGIPELLDLLGFFTFWDTRTKCWRVMEKPEVQRMRWVSMEFKGGSTADWQKFLSTITSTEHLR